MATVRQNSIAIGHSTVKYRQKSSEKQAAPEEKPSPKDFSGKALQIPLLQETLVFVPEGQQNVPTRLQSVNYGLWLA